MGTRGTPARPQPAIRSPWLLSVIATGMTLLSFGAMTYFAAGHVQEANAPLQPSAPAQAVAAPAPTPTPAPATRRRTVISPTVPTTPQAPVTRTRQSGR